MSVYIIGEIGINHNGDIDLAKRLIDGAKLAGCDAVKFQKRTLSTVYTEDYLDKPCDSPWGDTFRAQKERFELSMEEYEEIDEYCEKRDIDWGFSAWDVESQKKMRKFDCPYNKIASPMNRHKPLLEAVASEGKKTFISTGMSTLEEIDEAVEVFEDADCPYELMHCNSTYPMENDDANLKMIETLQDRYGCDVGYSGHEKGRIVSFAACVLGATSLERHITLDRGMYGPDQAASIEIQELCKLVNDVRSVDDILGDGKKKLRDSEKEVRNELSWYEEDLEV